MLKQIIEDNFIRFSAGQDPVLSLERQHTEDTATVICEGEFRGELVQDVEAILLRYIQAGFILYLDFSKVTYIASSMQDTLISLQKAVENGHRGLLILRALSEHVRSELEETGVIDCLPVLGISESQSEVDNMVKDARKQITPPLIPPVISVKQDTHTHDHRPVRTVPPTCAAQGYTLYECACGDSYNGDFTAKLPHRYTASVIAPTELEQGYTLHKCECCGHTYTSDIIEPIHKHNYQAVETVKPTCLAEGYTRFVCGCGDSYRGNFTPKASHSYQETVIAPTTSEGGYTLHKCSVCGHEFKDTFVDPVHTHNYQVAQVVPATCTAEGYTRYVCSCGDGYNDRFTPKLSHSYIDSVTEPTQDSQGYIRHRCSQCGHTYTDIIPRLHRHDYQVVTSVPATCTAEGYTRYECSCGDGYTQTTPKLDHQYTVTTVSPTDEDQGYDLHKCRLCGHEFKDNYKPALGGTVADPPPGGGGGTVKDPTPNHRIQNLLLIRLRTGKALLSNQSMIAIGRHQHQCDFVVTENNRISNHHADIIVYKDKVSLRDSGSTNGTFLGQQKLEASKAVPLECPAFFRLHTEDFLLLWGKPAEEAMEKKQIPMLKNPAVGSLRLPERYPFLLGRHNPWKDGVTMTSQDMKVGREHGRILLKDGNYLLERLHPTNSTRLNGQYLDLGKTEKLSHGDQIRMGDTTLEFSLIEIKEIIR